MSSSSRLAFSFDFYRGVITALRIHLQEFSYSAKSLMFPLPVPGSQPRREPIKWDAAYPYRGLGFREIDADGTKIAIAEFPVRKV